MDAYTISRFTCGSIPNRKRGQSQVLRLREIALAFLAPNGGLKKFRFTATTSFGTDGCLLASK